MDDATAATARASSDPTETSRDPRDRQYLSAHTTKGVTAFLEAHPPMHLHFTPTYSFWLNQVELWFAKIERDLLARGILTWIPDLARKIRRYITRYNATRN